MPEEVLLDNARALVLHHDATSREVVVHPRLHAFARRRGFPVRACAPYRARTKGTDERGVGYVKRNAIADRSIVTWAEPEAQLEAWTRDAADRRLHGTAGEAPFERFRREEARALKPLSGIPPFATPRDLIRRLDADCAEGVEVDGTACSVPWQLINKRVRVMVEDGTPRSLHTGRQDVVHAARKNDSDTR